jgi:small subunit ribosomal protein S5
MAQNMHRDDNRAPSEFQEEVIHIARVARVVKGGRRFRFRALVAVGNGHDKVGVGIAKGGDVQTAVTKAVESAKKRLIIIPVVNETIPHETTSKIGGGVVMLRPAAPGTGVIAGGTVRAILDLSGIHNILSKSLGSTNKVNIAYATISALSQLQPKGEWITSQATAKASPTPKKATAKTAASKLGKEKVA